jgi:hypothetical protein
MPIPIKHHPTIPLTPLGAALPMRAELLTIQPEEAQAMLDDHNTRNRSPIPSSIATVFAALKEDYFEINGETIVVCEDGVLGDGQNRLMACAQAGVPMTTWVIFGITAEAFKTIDRGRGRTIACDLSILGHRNSNNLTAVCRMIHAYRRGLRSMDLVAGNFPFKLEDAQAIADAHPEIQDSVRIGKQMVPPVAARVAGTAHFLMSKINKDDATRFFDAINSGANLEPKSPILAVRTKLFTIKQGNESGSRHGIYGNVGTFTQAHAMWRGWNAFRERRLISHLSIATRDGQGGSPVNLPELV